MIEREERGTVTVVTLKHGKVNALDTELLRDFLTCLEEVAASATGAIVLTGAGPAFSAGVDLNRLLAGGHTYVRELLPLLEHALERLFSLGKPTVAAVNGHAIAGGHLLMAACDRRLMAVGKGRLGVPEVLVGAPLPPIGVEILRATLSPDLLQDVAYTGRTFGAEEALARGMVHELIAPEELLARAVKEAERLAGILPMTYQLTKRQLLAPFLAEAARRHGEMGGELTQQWASPAVADQIRAYLAQTLGKKA